MRRTSLVRRTAAASVALLVLTGVAGCGDDPEPEDVATETRSTDPAEPSEPVETGPVAGEEVDSAAFFEGLFSGLTSASTAHLTLEIQGGPAAMTAEGDIDYSTSPPSMSMSMSNPMLGDGDTEIRLVDGVIYLKIDRMGDKWIRYDLGGKGGNPMGEDLADQLDPSAGLEIIKDAVVSVTYVGDEEVDGETLGHYTMQVRSKAVRELEDQLGAQGKLDLPDVMEYDVWLDEAGMLRKSQMTMGELGSVTTTLSAWGEPVDIQAPPEAEVMQLPDGVEGF